MNLPRIHRKAILIALLLTAFATITFIMVRSSAARKIDPPAPRPAPSVLRTSPQWGLGGSQIDPAKSSERAATNGIAKSTTTTTYLRAPNPIPFAPLTYTPTIFTDPAISGAGISVNTSTGVITGGAGNGQISLRSAIFAANNHSGADTITLSAGTYLLQIAPIGDGNLKKAAYNSGTSTTLDLTGSFDITDDLTINGAGQASTFVDGNNLDLVFSVNSFILNTNSSVNTNGVAMTFTNLTVQHGNNVWTDGGDGYSSGAGIWWESAWVGGQAHHQGSLTLTNVSVDHNTSSNGGGAAGIVLFNEGTVSMTNCTVSNNTNIGGAAGGGTLAIANSASVGDNQHGTVTITNTDFIGNTTQGSGGAIQYIGGINPYAVTISGGTISGNSAAGGGGIAAIQGPSTGFTITNNTVITNNHATAGDGGGIGSFLNVTISPGTVITNNTATGNGGGLVLGSGSSVTRSTITGNTAGKTGGGISIFGTNIDFTGVAVSLPKPSVTFNLITGNTAPAGGNEIDNRNVSATISDNWFGTNLPTVSDLGSSNATPLASIGPESPGATVNATTQSPHPFVSGQLLQIAGTPAQIVGGFLATYDGPATCNSASPLTQPPTGITVTDSTHFSYCSFRQAGAPTIPAISGGEASTESSIVAASESGTTVTITVIHAVPAHGVVPAQLDQPHRLVVGQPVRILGITGANTAGYNGEFVVTSVPSSTTFTYTAPAGLANIADSGNNTSIGSFRPLRTNITHASESGSTVTLTLDAAAGSASTSYNFAVGNLISVVGVPVAGYNGTAIVTGVSGSTLTYTSPSTGLTTSNSTAGGVRKLADSILQLKHTAAPSTIRINQSTTLTASFLTDSAGNAVSTTNLSTIIGRPITFNNPVDGTISNPQATIQSNGTATATFNAGGVAGGGKADATVDNGTATANIVVLEPLRVVKSFGPTRIPINGTTTLTFSVNNPNVIAVDGSFTDTLPANMKVAATPAATNTCGGTFTPAANATSVTWSNASLSVGVCSISVNITATVDNVYNNSVTINSTAAGTGALSTSSANLTVINPPHSAKAFGAPAIPLNGTSSLTFTLDSNSNQNLTLTGVALSDNLPSGLQVAATPNASSTCGGSFAPAAGDTTVNLSGVTLSPNSSCTASVNVKGTTAGLKTNNMTPTSTNGGSGAQATATITVVAPPTISKAFNPTSIPLNTTSTLTFTINNPNTTALGDLTGIAFSDTLPATTGTIVVAPTPNVSNTCGGTVTATSGTGVISLSGGSVAHNGSCTLSVDVKGSAAGDAANTTGAITSIEGGTGTTSNTATLKIVAPPTISKAFGAADLPLNATTTVTFTITNPTTNTSAESGIAFSDTLTNGLRVASTPGVINTCGGTVTATANSTSISLTGGSITTPGTTCSITVNLTGTQLGNVFNTTGAASSTNGGTGTTSNTATAHVCSSSITVSNTNDSGAGSLRQAMLDACDGATITFDTASAFATPQTITLGGTELTVDKNVIISAPAAAANHVTISGNNASRVFNVAIGKTATMKNLTISGGMAGVNGAIATSGGTLNLINSTVSGNSGGGIFVDAGGSATVINSTISGNSATVDGAGIQTTATATSLTLINATISGNTANGFGGGVDVLGGTAIIINSTITNNHGDNDDGGGGGAGGLRRQGGTVTLKNTIIAGNFAGSGTSTRNDIEGAVDAASSNNLIGDGTNMSGITNGSQGNQVGSSGSPIDPQLGPLADNGGTTQTHALLATSPAIEAGSNANLPTDAFDVDGDANTAETLPVDQRGAGFPRVADSADADVIQTVDIGAFELHPSIEDIPNQSTNEDTVKNVIFNLGDATGSLIATVTATSSNTTLVPNANLSFSGSGGSRTLQITPAANQSGATTITVTVTATNGRIATDTFDLAVAAVNDPPAGTDNTVSTAEDTAYTFTAADFGFTDPNDSPANTLLAVKLTTLPALGALTNNNVPVNAGDFIPVADINGGLLKFTPVANGNGTPYTTLTFQVQDNGGGTDLDPTPNTMTINVTAVNDGPVNTVPGPQSTNEDTALVFSTGNGNQISVADVDAGSNPIKVTLTATNGTLTLSTTAGLVFVTGDGVADATMMFTGPLAAVNTALNGLSFTPAADFNGAASLQIVADDQGNSGSGGPLTDSDAVNITVNAQNDPPVVTTTAGNLAYTENGGAVVIDSGLTVTDIDSTNLTGATVAITAGFVSAQDTLGFTNQLGITGNYNSGTGLLTLTGTTTVANYQTALRSVTYQNSSDNPTVSRTVTFTANDGAATGSATRGIAITAVNDPPVNTVPGPQSTNQNTPLTFSSGNGNQISISDPDAGTNAVQVTLTATNGTLTLNGTSGLAFTIGDGTADSTMTFTGTIANINTAVNGVSFTPNAGFSGAGGLSIATNDLGNTGTGGPLSDADSINIQVSTNLSIQDASIVEPSTGSVNMIFTVTLSAPAPAGGAAVNFTTQDQTPALNHATAGQDYTVTSGTLNFAQGEQIKTILVPILSDNKKSEANETFLVVLSNPVNLTISDGSATGTIRIANQPGAILISELRTSGPAGAGDDFVEIYNNSDSPHTVNDGSGINDAAHGYGLYKMGADCNASPILIGVIPNGTVIPARGHYLFVGSAYSLSNYGGTGAAAGDQVLNQDIENDRNVALFSTTSLLNLATETRLDAVGFGTNTGGICDLLREGTNLPPASGSVLEYSYFRDECGKDGNPSSFGPCSTNGMVQDLNNNSLDFLYGNTTGTLTPAGQLLAAPGPQNLGNPRLNLSIGALLLDATKGSTADPNRVRDNTPALPNAMNGTLSVRRRIVNNTGAPVTRLRFRIVDLSVFPVTGATADLRALSSSNITVSGIKDSATCSATGTPTSQPCTVTVFGTALETPPTQSLGGGLNSSFNAGTITLPAPLAPGQSINLQFLLGVQKTGSFKFFFNVEALP